MSIIKALPLVVVVLLLGPVGAQPADADGAGRSFSRKAHPGAIQDLISLLGSDRYARREEAARALLKLGKEAMPYLEAALDSKNPEVRRRARLVLDETRTRVRARAVEQVALGGVDQHVERLVLKKDRLTQADWSNVLLLGEATSLLVDMGKRPRGLSNERCLRSRAIVTNMLRESKQVCDARVVADRVTIEGAAANCVIVCKDAAKIQTVINCLLFVNGNAKLGGVVDSIIICDGRVEVSSGLCNSVLLARRGAVVGGSEVSAILAQGPVIVGTAKGVLVRSTDSVKISIATKCVLRTEKTVEVLSLAPQWPSKLEQHKAQPDVFGQFKFFEPARLGVQVKCASGVVSASEVTPGKAFARAGLRVGDVIIGIDKANVKSADTFRTLLRAGELAGQVTVSVRRKQEFLDVIVRFETQVK